MDVSEIIIERIKKEGPIPFRDYMDMCLYYPEVGYYTSPGEKIGMLGDFYTAPYLTSLFGEIIATQLEEMWRLMGKKAFTIVEYGAGSGLLCQDILVALEKNPTLSRQLRYYIIEKSPVMRGKEISLLPPGRVQWVDSILDIEPFTGCILCNEVIDNFPVHQIVMNKGMKEVFVDYRNGFVEKEQDAGTRLQEYLSEEGIVLPQGYRTEINLEVSGWVRDIATRLDRGFLLVFDYGYPAAEFYSPARYEGTLTCYHKHTVNHCPYLHIGQQDITAHVDFTSLSRQARLHGLENGGFTDQASFLLGSGLTEKLREGELKNAGKAPYDAARGQNNTVPGQNDTESRQNDTEPGQNQLREILLTGMGRRLKVLLLQKGVPGARLPGMQFSRPLA